jgi:DNA-binding winged helix-turn-helix (wHTH) protein
MRYEFADFRLDPGRRELTRANGIRVELPPRALDALLLLVERPGELRNKQSLLKTLWPDTMVEDNSLDQVMSQLRRALGAGVDGTALIGTEKGRGYRFLADVRCLSVQVQASDARMLAQSLLDQARVLVHRPSASNLDGAFGLLSAAMDADPTFTPALAERALVRTLFVTFDLPMPGALTLAANEASEAIAQDPGLWRAHQALANVLVARRRYVEAREHFDTACRLEPVPDARITRTWQISLTVGHLKLALQQAREALNLSPVMPLSTIAMAVACNALGMTAEAAQCADRAVALGWPRWQAPICDIRLMQAVRLGQFDTAAECARAILSERQGGGDFSRLATSLAAALESPGERSAAVTSLREYVNGLDVSSAGKRNLKRAAVWFALLETPDDTFWCIHRILDHAGPEASAGHPWDALWIPEMRPLRRDRRFQQVVERLGFRDYWLKHGPPDDPEVLAL